MWVTAPPLPMAINVFPSTGQTDSDCSHLCEDIVDDSLLKLFGNRLSKHQIAGV